MKPGFVIQALPLELFHRILVCLSLDDIKVLEELNILDDTRDFPPFAKLCTCTRNF